MEISNLKINFAIVDSSKIDLSLIGSIKFNENMFDEILKQSLKEKPILKEIEALQIKFEQSEHYKSFKKQLDDLYDELRKERLTKAQTVINTRRTKRRKGKKTGVITKSQTFSSDYYLCEEIFDRLSRHEKHCFFDAHCKSKRSEIEKLPHPKMTQEDINELHDLLVGVCVDYLASKGFDDVDDISLSIDGLRGSVEAVEWIPATDSFLSVFGYGKNDNDDFPTKKLIGESY